MANKDYYYQIATGHFYTGAYEAARDALRLQLELFPNHASAHALLARSYEQLFNTTLADKHYAVALENCAFAMPWLRHYGNYQLQRGRYAEAEAALFRMLINNPSANDCYEDIARCLTLHGALRAAIELIEQMLKQSPTKIQLKSLEQYLLYRLSGHKKFLHTYGDRNLYYAIPGSALHDECSILNNEILKSFITKALRSNIKMGDVCLDIGSGVGLYSTLMGGLCDATAVIPIDCRPASSKALEFIVEKSDFLIETQYMGHALADGSMRLMCYENAPLGFAPRPDINGNTQTVTLDSLGIPRVNLILNRHMQHMELAFIEGAQQTLIQEKPVCIFEVNQHNVSDVEQRMQALGYTLAGGDYIAPNYTAMHCIFKPN